MTCATHVDIRNAGGAIFFSMPVAERAGQPGRLCVTEMIKHNGLINSGPGKNREDTVKEVFCSDLKSVISDDARKENANKHYKTHEFSFHSIN